MDNDKLNILSTITTLKFNEYHTFLNFMKFNSLLEQKHLNKVKNENKRKINIQRIKFFTISFFTIQSLFLYKKLKVNILVGLRISFIFTTPILIYLSYNKFIYKNDYDKIIEYYIPKIHKYMISNNIYDLNKDFLSVDDYDPSIKKIKKDINNNKFDFLDIRVNENIGIREYKINENFNKRNTIVSIKRKYENI